MTTPSNDTKTRIKCLKLYTQIRKLNVDELLATMTTAQKQILFWYGIQSNTNVFNSTEAHVKQVQEKKNSIHDEDSINDDEESINDDEESINDEEKYDDDDDATNKLRQEYNYLKNQILGLDEKLSEINVNRFNKMPFCVLMKVLQFLTDDECKRLENVSMDFHVLGVNIGFLKSKEALYLNYSTEKGVNTANALTRHLAEDQLNHMVRTIRLKVSLVAVLKVVRVLYSFKNITELVLLDVHITDCTVLVKFCSLANKYSKRFVLSLFSITFGKKNPDDEPINVNKEVKKLWTEMARMQNYTLIIGLSVMMYLQANNCNFFGGVKKAIWFQKISNLHVELPGNRWSSLQSMMRFHWTRMVLRDICITFPDSTDFKNVWSKMKNMKPMHLDSICINCECRTWNLEENILGWMPLLQYCTKLVLRLDMSYHYARNAQIILNWLELKKKVQYWMKLNLCKTYEQEFEVRFNCHPKYGECIKKQMYGHLHQQPCGRVIGNFLRRHNEKATVCIKFYTGKCYKQEYLFARTGIESCHQCEIESLMEDNMFDECWNKHIFK